MTKPKLSTTAIIAIAKALALHDVAVNANLASAAASKGLPTPPKPIKSISPTGAAGKVTVVR